MQLSDKADEEFEAFLLELISYFQILIPEIRIVKTKYKPIVILTSNRTRQLSDTLDDVFIIGSTIQTYKKNPTFLKREHQILKIKLAVQLVYY